jgi:excisionase family DNA binding protein
MVFIKSALHAKAMKKLLTSGTYIGCAVRNLDALRNQENSPQHFPTTASPEPFVSAEAVADCLAVNPRRVKDHARSGQFPAYPIENGHENSAALSRIPTPNRVELNRADIETQLHCASPEGGERMTLVEKLGRLSRLLSTKEVAEILRIHQETVYTLVRDEGLPSVRIGRARRFDGVLVAKWIEQRSS